MTTLPSRGESILLRLGTLLAQKQRQRANRMLLQIAMALAPRAHGRAASTQPRLRLVIVCPVEGDIIEVAHSRLALRAAAPVLRLVLALAGMRALVGHFSMLTV